MRSLENYSRNKFQSFTSEEQIKALSKLLNSLEMLYADAIGFQAQYDHISECIRWMEQPLPVEVHRLFADLTSNTELHNVSDAIARFRSSLGLTYKDTQLNIIKGDGSRTSDPLATERSRQIIVILDNLRSVFNIGSIFRSAECLSLKEIWLCGVCATPANPALAKTAMGTAERVPWRYFPHTQEAIQTARSEGYTLYALETTQSATSVFETRFQLPLALLLGNESLGISPEILKLCDQHISLPVQGWKNSLNVAVAFSICAYQLVFGSADNPNKTGENNG